MSDDESTTPKHTAIKLLLCLAGSVLFLTGAAKLIAADGSARLLDVADPLLILTNKQLLLSVGILEVALAGYLFFGRNLLLKAGLTTWIATNFGLYKLGLYWMGSKQPCGCLGKISDALGISANTAKLLSNIALGYLLVVGIVSQVVLLKRRPTTDAPESTEPLTETTPST